LLARGCGVPTTRNAVRPAPLRDPPRPRRERLLEYPVFEDDPNLDVPEDAPLGDPGMYPNPLAFDILEDDLKIADGRFRLPDGPGLGVTVNTDCIEEYAFREGAWTEFEYQ
jgi:hypothetical protein